MFSLDNFVEDCKAAIEEDPTHQAVRGCVESVISEPNYIIKELGEPKKSGVEKLFVSENLTILNIIWAPMMTLMPHNHEMWAVIGIYSGREDNVFWRRIENAKDGRIEAAGAKALSTGDVVPMGKNIIHSVTNPIPRYTAALHIYGGNFFETPRSEWDAETLREESYNVEKTMRLFEEFNNKV